MKHLSQLMGNPDAKVRLYALDELIRNAHRMTETDLAEALEKASGDEDRAVSMRATEGLAILEQRGFKQLRRARDRRGALNDLTGTFEEDSMAREAAYKVLDWALQELGNLAGDMVVARAAASLDALGSIRHPASLGPILKGLGRRDTGQAAARALGQYPEDAALPVFKKALQSPAYPEATAVCLGGLGALDGEGSFLLLQENLESPDPKIREAVALALGGRAETEAEAMLIKLSRDSEPVVVQASVTSLGLVGERDGAERLHEVFLNAGDVRVQAAVLTALGLIHRHESVEVIAKGLRSPDGRVRANAIEALSAFDLRAPEAVRYFDPALRDDNNRAAGNAILAIYPYDRDRALAVLKSLLKAKEALKRSTAAYIIGELQDPVLLQGLITMINTEQDRNVLSSALNSISRIRNPELKMGIAKLCQHPNDLIRGRAIQIFAGMSGLSELKVLESYFQKETSPTVKATIVQAFGQVCDMNHLAFLKTKLADQDPRIVANAVEALDKVGALENAELIEPLTKHRNPRVRANALVALWHQGQLRAADSLGEMLETMDDDQLSSGLHAAKAFGRAVSPLGLKRHPLLRSSLQNAFERMSSMGVTSWDLFRSSQFYQDVILPEADEPTEEEIAAAPEDDAGDIDISSADTGMTLEIPPEPSADDQPAVTAEPGASAQPPSGSLPSEAALVAGLGSMIVGRSERAQQFLSRDMDAGDLQGVIRYVERRAAKEAGVAPSDAPLEDAGEGPPFLPLYTARIEDARRSHDLGQSLSGYFSLFRAQLEMVRELVEVGERTLASGDEAAAARIAKDLAQRVKGDAGAHRELGDLHFAARDYPAAYPHLLRAWAYNPDEPQLLLRLASVAARVGKKKLARAMIKVLTERMECDEATKAKAANLGKILGV